MRRAIVLTAVLVGVVGMVPTVPATADPLPPYVVAGRSADGFAYYNPVVAVPVDGSLTMVSADPLDRHNIVSTEYGSDDEPWCTTYPAGQCPLFWSRLVTTLPASGGPTSEVQGLENLEPFDPLNPLELQGVYSFYCSLHAEMQGTLIALPPV